MTNNPFRSTDLSAEVKAVFGDRASEWMHTPNRLFDNLAPSDLATTPEGVQVVLIELRRSSAIHVVKSLGRRQP